MDLEEQAFVERLTRARQLEAILTYIRAQALKGTADDEVKLTRLVDAIERGEHEG